MTETREEHQARKPRPDGWVDVRLAHSGENERLLNSDGKGWSFDRVGIRQALDERTERLILWSSVVEYTLTRDSDEFEKSMISWIRDCDHDWITYNTTTRCEYCRLDLADLAEIAAPDLITVPDLIRFNPTLDLLARKNDGHQPDVATALPDVTSPAVGIIRVDSASMESFCDCQDALEAMNLQHSGRCKYRPDTWVLASPSDDDGLSF